MPYLDFTHSNRVESTIRYRPSYPHQLIDYLYTDGGFSRESVIADIGSETGTLSRLLLERGSRVVAIEPDDLLRLTAERLLSEEFQRFVSIKGTAVNTTLSDASIHHIVCAQSHQSVDINKCKAEFSRILKPNGTVTLIWNRRVAECKGFTAEYEQLLNRYILDSDNKGFHKMSPNEFSSFFGTDRYAFISLPNQQILDLDGVKGGLLAKERLPALARENYSDMMAELSRIFECYSQSGKVVLRFETEAYTSQFNRVS